LSLALATVAEQEQEIQKMKKIYLTPDLTLPTPPPASTSPLSPESSLSPTTAPTPSSTCVSARDSVQSHVAMTIASSVLDLYEKVQSLITVKDRNCHGIWLLSDEDKKQSTKDFLKNIASNLQLPTEEHVNFIERWDKGLGGSFCKTVGQIQVLVKSSVWEKTVLEELPEQNNMVKAEIENSLRIKM